MSRKRASNLRDCPHCGGRYRVLKSESEWVALERHTKSLQCLATTVTRFAMENGWVRATDLSTTLKKAGVAVRYLPCLAVGGDSPTRAPWARAEAVEAATIMRKVRAKPLQRQCWLQMLATNSALREAARAARRLGGPSAVRAVMRQEELADADGE